jgi:hypothetical protein
MRNKVYMMWVMLIVCLVFPAAWSFAQDNAEVEGKKRCLTCHGEKGSVKKFSDGDAISTYVDAKALDMSVHGSLLCTACHKEFSDKNHPDRAFRNKAQYRIKESHGCRD